MKRSVPRQAVAFLLTFLILVPLLRAVPSQVNRTPLGDDGSMVEVTSVFSYTPPTGYLPLRIKVVNNSGDNTSVKLTTISRSDGSYSGGHELESSFSIAAPAGKTTEREYLAPVCASTQSTGYRYGSSGSMRVLIQAGSHTNTIGIDTGGFQDLPFTLFSESLASKTIDDLNRSIPSPSSSSSYRSGNEAFAAIYSAPLLPADWRGYSGVDQMVITGDEWTALSAGVKTAILQWVKLGGTLRVYSKEGSPSLVERGIPAGKDAGVEGALGMGWVLGVKWDGGQLSSWPFSSWSGTTRKIESQASLREPEPSSRSGGLMPPTPLVKVLGEKSFAAWQVGIILFIFGIVVGPVNLFYLARSGRRHRLFLTTPLISLGAAALLLLMIFFQDGTGGQGHRAAVVYLDAGEKNAFVHQFQASRTGVLFGGSFTQEEPAVVTMALMPESRWTRLKGTDDYGSYRGARGEAQKYTVSDRFYAGDWFQSRAEQAQVIDSVQSTRGRLELKPGPGAPVLVSSLPGSLERVWYFATDSRYWISPGEVTTGASVTMSEATGGDFQKWRDEAISMLPASARSALSHPPAPGFFYADSRDPATGAVDTLGSIEWKSSRIFLYGPLAP